ncbi:MAG TPA: glycoside hydrolase family 15 protein [Archangium sp.]|uniref:glycoside hydrolase family 15 protein n=1 Tax=Archangium sp. TaxID=1872627 RepID=UPI002E36A0AA|nr:glycoside hydrolase family 15 protein [Archangium sp.]HEX5751260.1 glycoside hydrolase family 15 protein [Archangium sp.]
MPLRIEDYALIGDTQSAALVGKDGSIDWLCLPRFDADACFAALLGSEQHGRWLLAPSGGIRRVQRRYRPGTLILETDFETDTGTLRVVDCMPPRGREPDLVREVLCLKGHVSVHMVLAIRFGYGSRTPWVHSLDGRFCAMAGPDALILCSDVPPRLEGSTLRAGFSLSAGQCARFLLTWYPSHEPVPTCIDPATAVENTEAWWREWSSHCTHDGPWREQVLRSLIVLKALTYSPTGGIVAAPTTSLPEALGGVRNWDYRYCWLRDATFTLLALLDAGYREEASAWRDWLLRAVAGEPDELQIMYGVAGERRLMEQELPWLSGYQGASPVRLGNAAVCQFQLDVFGEVLDCLHMARRSGVPAREESWNLKRHLLDFLESNWERPDEGIWEVRGPPQHFTYSKVMAWVAVDRAIKTVEQYGLPGPVERWRALRARIHAQVCERGYDAGRGSFVQAYGSRELDAALLLIPQLGFLPPSDPRVVGTVDTIQRELSEGGLVRRYDTRRSEDGLPPGEGTFLACSFWLADALTLLCRLDEAQALFERLLSLCNDVGLLAEEYDPRTKRQLGNFPQAFSHVALINTAQNLTSPSCPITERPRA